jgi:sec-independent protein translocase protein TatA
MSTSISFILLFGISGGEIIVVFLLVLLLFGPKKIPEIARSIGKGMNEIKKVQRDINAEINRYSREIENPAKQIKEDIEGFKKGLNDQVAETFAEPGASPIETKGADETVVTPATETDNSLEQPYPYKPAGSVEEADKINSTDKDSKK